MGTDIHFFAEYRDNPTAPWKFLPAPPTEGYMPGDDEPDAEGRPKGWPYRFGTVDTTAPGYVPGYDNRHVGCGDDRGYLRNWFDDSNYRLFGMLANVRNGRGFADIVTGERVEPIAEPRGWPDDCCPELDEERTNIDHTPTWLTVAEMQEYFAKMREADLTVIGCISGQQYEALRDRGEMPTSWSGGGRNIVVLDARIYDLIPPGKIRHSDGEHPALDPSETRVDFADLPQGVTDGRKDELRTIAMFDAVRGTTTPAETEARVFVQAIWKKSAASYFERFEHALAEMVEAAGVEPENVRAVFYFDS